MKVVEFIITKELHTSCNHEGDKYRMCLMDKRKKLRREKRKAPHEVMYSQKKGKKNGK